MISVLLQKMLLWILVSLDDSQSGVLLNLSDKKVLYAKGAYNKVYPASLTKIMTAMLALKYGNMDDTVTISQENVTLESGSQVAGSRREIRLPWISFFIVFLFILPMMQQPAMQDI